jgi:hypothetical protein
LWLQVVVGVDGLVAAEAAEAVLERAQVYPLLLELGTQ